MKRILPLAVALVVLAAVAPAGRAAWGWPPPIYSVTGVSACDGSPYRGLCTVLRDRRHGVCPGGVLASPTICDACACPDRATPGGAAPTLPNPQAPAPSSGPRP